MPGWTNWSDPMAYPHVFKPLTLRHKTLKNRIVFGAHTTNMADLGLPGERHKGYYLERARGGAGMIVVEPVPVHRAAVLIRGNFLPDDDAVIPGFRDITDACKAQGTVMIQQLYHVGAHGDWDNSWHANWSPSGGPSYHDNDGSHAMSAAEIEETIASTVRAAVRAKAAGFDGVETWATYHALLDQFWNPWSNTRDDEWGGSLENRMRFSMETMRRIRAACGEDFIIGLAVNDEPDVEIALTREETTEIVGLHDDAGLIDYVTVGAGSYQDFYKIIPSFQYGEKLTADLASMIKARVSTAKVISEAGIRTPENANTLLGEGVADLVSIVRGQIADPWLVSKAESGHEDDIRGCLSCNQQCWGRRGRDYYISCLINPSVGHEFQWGGDKFSATLEPKRVLVVGGGVAGCEVARVAAERGHSVVLAEASDRLGGQFRLAGLQPRRGQITELVEWYERQLQRLGVDVRFGTYLEADEIAAMQVDEVVLATGSLPMATGFQKALAHVEEMPGVNLPGVAAPEDVMGRAARLGKRVVVLDEAGNWRGCGTAWRLAEDGHEVTIVTPAGMVGSELFRSSTDLPLRRTLAGLGVQFVTEHSVTGWTGQAAEVVGLLTGESREIAADGLVLATGNRADNGLWDRLRALGIEARLVGDAHAPRNAAAAIYEGRVTGLEL
ncbi:FAD-dependent oxidoreductase [Alisedimentitalea sp. MJ-SS2]|uniref:oxidoreductase n=1 Tax=Aliisedimentitalea sp. MJ-SS2 TaxID=3049795 RepID=UPI00290EE2F4|nr:FAD-dependent oxidoreductase [Alisedimentitalea sp. MJ-SS2]MDU8928180.1 FAD-dependent oxidoreductase [Alisedimentitalea sp. MJ-SS2]